ncbi:putative bifunctional diguanylate cyclase/phosphodiesterase [Pannonibacter phragmitetus]|uniref:putative bifunctional diguanylate cyclase/phosphodiesterase n=1 Tax=Pannonibacter phragmitetus TaxID=121719 RepID=UPI001AD91C57|nr:EAL domain-containing protein [Pannonibacter phragmitetus]
MALALGMAWKRRTGQRFGLRMRFTLFVVLLFACLTAITLVTASVLDYQDEQAKSVAHVHSIGATVSRLAVPQLANHHYLILSQELESIAASGLVQQAYVWDPRRTILVDSDPKTGIFEQQEINPLLLAAYSAKEDQTLVETGRISVAMPVWSADGSTVAGAVLVSAERTAITSQLHSIWLRNAIVSVCLLAVAVPVLLHFGNGFLKPIKRLTSIAHQVSAGEFDVKFPVERTDEIGVLARAYRDMVSEISSNMEQINKLAFTDSVTGLPNREAFRQHFARYMRQADGSPRPLTVMFIDLDRFKRINDSYGHDCGDILLREVASRFEAVLQTFGRSETGFTAGYGMQIRYLARLGGDEFALIYPAGEDRRDEILALAAEILKAVEEPCDVNGLQLSIGASIGIANFPSNGRDFSAILKNADIAMYAAKNTGGSSCFTFGQIAADVKAQERLALEAELPMALAAGQITVFFQPKVSAATGEVTGAEALARWIHPERGLLTPAAFIAIAEETGLILRLGDRVLELACRQGREWLDEGRGLSLAVNVSMRQLEWPEFPSRVLEILDRTGFPPSLLELEVTESVAMADPERVRSATERLRMAGIRFAIDDFGTGYSSLAHLQRMHFDTFKIDRSFVAGLGEDKSNRAIVQTILAMAQSLDYDVVAEGVETEFQLDFLRLSGCKTVQGFLLGKPMAAETFIKWRAAHEGEGYEDLPALASSSTVPMENAGGAAIHAA